MWCIPEKANGEFVACMEDVLDIYCQAYDERYPTVCMDETNKQLVAQVLTPLPVKPGQPERYDYLFEACGAANLFLFFEPLAGQRFLQVTHHRTKRDWALAIRDLVDSYYPHAERITLIMDNLNTHTLGALYDTFEPTEAYRIARRLDIHYTPKHGSWLNMAEIEFSVLHRQCLDQRIPDAQTLHNLVMLWQSQRNAQRIKVDWQFTTADARIKLKRLYPSFHA